MRIAHKNYPPFGMLMPGRSYTTGNAYRFGFNGKENDDEVKGEGNSLDFGDRIYDSRLGRWLTIDPLVAKYSPWSPYNAFEDSPILLIDKSGNGAEVSMEKNKSGHPILKVTMTIYVYSSDANVLSEMNCNVDQIQKEVNNNFNKNFTTIINNKGEQGIRIPVIFDIHVAKAGENGSVEDAQKLLNSGALDDPSKNIINLNNTSDNSGNSNTKTFGNSGSWSVNDLTKPNVRAHEICHLLGIQFINDGQYGDHADVTKFPFTNSASTYNPVSFIDIDHLNFGFGVANRPDKGTAQAVSPTGLSNSFNPSKNKYIGTENNNVLIPSSEYVDDCSDEYDHQPQK